MSIRKHTGNNRMALAIALACTIPMGASISNANNRDWRKEAWQGRGKKSKPKLR